MYIFFNQKEFVSPSVRLVAGTEELQRIKNKIVENVLKGALKGPKFRKKCGFFLTFQGVLCQKVRFLAQKHGEHTHRQTHTEVLITEYPLCLCFD